MNDSNMTGGPAGQMRKLGPWVAGVFFVLVGSVFLLSRAGCSNHHTPPGYVGYVRSEPLFGAGEYVGIQRGPTSTGWVWRQSVTNIDVRPKTYTEDMTIPTRERLEIKVRVHARIRLKSDGVKDVVEKFGGEDWYVNNVRDQYRAAVRDKVQKLDVFAIKDDMRRIGDESLADMKKRYQSTPIEFLSVDIGDIGYPPTVVNSVVAKFVTNEENERKDIELKIAQRQIEIGIAEAQGIADSQKIIRTTLDPMFLQFEALRAIEGLSNAPNTTFLMFPFGKNGTGSPTIMLPSEGK